MNYGRLIAGRVLVRGAGRHRAALEPGLRVSAASASLEAGHSSGRSGGSSAAWLPFIAGAGAFAALTSSAAAEAGKNDVKHPSVAAAARQARDAGFVTHGVEAGDDGQAPIEVGYMSDCEGNIEYFRRCVLMSSVLEFVPGSNETQLRMVPDDVGEGGLAKVTRKYFVFGGDTFDRGPGDVRIARALIDLKKRYPSRVFLLIGNRDLNKMKMSSELHPSVVAAHRIDDSPLPYWQLPGHPMTLRWYLCRMLRERVAPSGGGRECSDEELLPLDTRANRLRHMLAGTMGSPGAFEHRRRELAVLARMRARGGDEHVSEEEVARVSDDEVVASYYDSVTSPDANAGFVREYLQLGQLGVVLGNTLFVHGSCRAENIGFVPGEDNKDRMQKAPPGEDAKRRLDARAWIDTLNDFASRHLADWVARPTWQDEAHTVRGGSPLMGYGYFNAMRYRTVVISKYVDNNGPDSPRGHPVFVGDEVVRYLREAGVHRVVVGHHPFGDCPLVMRPDRAVGTGNVKAPGATGGGGSGLEVVMADTSYSDAGNAKRGRGFDTRGIALSSITIHGTMACNATHVQGVLADGRPIEYDLPPVGACTVAGSAPRRLPCCDRDPLVGLETPQGWWVKAVLAPGVTPRTHKTVEVDAAGAPRRYLLVRGNGRNPLNAWCSRAEVIDALNGGALAQQQQ